MPTAACAAGRSACPPRPCLRPTAALRRPRGGSSCSCRRCRPAGSCGRRSWSSRPRGRCWATPWTASGSSAVRGVGDGEGEGLGGDASVVCGTLGPGWFECRDGQRYWRAGLPAGACMGACKGQPYSVAACLPCPCKHPTAGALPCRYAARSHARLLVVRPCCRWAPRRQVVQRPDAHLGLRRGQARAAQGGGVVPRAGGRQDALPAQPHARRHVHLRR